MANFWKQLNKPIYALAPLAGITDTPFRQLCKEFGADVVYSEMASATALVYNPQKTLELLQSEAHEAPYVIQLFGSEPDHFAQAVKLLSDEVKCRQLGVERYRGPEGFDINFGCPVPKVVKQGAGVALFKDLERSHQVIEAVINNTNLPVSVKTRTQAGELGILAWLNAMSDLPISALMIHGRTYAQGFSGPIDLALIREARNYFSGVILANGGINNILTAKEVLDETGADGLGIGQGALGKPWFFSQLKGQTIDMTWLKLKLVILKHASLIEAYQGNWHEFRKHLLWYVASLPNAKDLRRQFNTIDNMADIQEILANN